jgi:N-acetyl-gamma-glutamyl-phosphate reductase
MAKQAKQVRCAIVGASGYAGLETIRLLAGHPGAQVVFATSNTYKSKSVIETFPNSGVPEGLCYSPHEDAPGFKGADVFFLALPHGESYGMIDGLLKNARVVDISADYRLRVAADYEKWYGYKHPKPALLKTAAFGLCEIYRKEIKKARLVANPGCYPTSVSLALHPLSKLREFVGGPIIVDSKSGYSGAGRSLKPHLLFSEAVGEFAPYAVTGHRHTSEMLQESRAALGRPVPLTFTPHLIPVARGIVSTIYAPLTGAVDEKTIRAAYEKFYKGERFVQIARPGRVPSIKQVVGTNNCLINVFLDKEINMLKIISTIDNLIKGAAGQAIQNMNLMLGLPEEAGLVATPWAP